MLLVPLTLGCFMYKLVLIIFCCLCAAAALLSFSSYLETQETATTAVTKPVEGTLHIFSAANRESELTQLLSRSSHIYGGVRLKIVIDESGHSMSGDKHFNKVDAMRKVDTMVPSPDDLVLFMDAFDTLVTISAREIAYRFTALEKAYNLNNTSPGAPAQTVAKGGAVVFNGVGRKCFPFEKWNKNPDKVLMLSNGVNVTGREVCDNFRSRFGGDDPCLNSGVYMGRARDVAAVNQFVWDNRNVEHWTDQSLFMHASKVFPNMLVDSNHTFMTTTHRLDVTESELCASRNVSAGLLHFTGRDKEKWIKKCGDFYLGDVLFSGEGPVLSKEKREAKERRQRRRKKRRRKRVEASR